MAVEITGDRTTARVLADESLVSEECLEQVRTLTDHPAFTEPIRVMPDAHWGAGSPVGFSMPLPDAVVPNVVGVDVGCGMAAANLGSDLPLADDDAERERRVREAVPMGRAVHDEPVRTLEQFPFERANRVFDRFADRFEDRFGRRVEPRYGFDGYDAAYVASLCDRVLAGRSAGRDRVERSVGTLGGGNHFVEFARAQRSWDYWLIVHSGSRYLGLAVAEYWQDRAGEFRAADQIRAAIPAAYEPYLRFDPETVSDGELVAWVTGDRPYIDRERLRAELDGSEIERAFRELGALGSDLDPTGPEEFDAALAHLEGGEADGYYVDMLFAQQYARWNRATMVDRICETLGVEPTDRFQSVHNYVDFRDLTIRKGATPAREGQRLVIPLNMGEGSLLARGKGNAAWNETAPHGAGRRMGRREAHETLDVAEFDEAMSEVYSESVGEATLDEAPAAYKSADAITDALEPTADVVDHLHPVHNLKATE
ncbi:MAG: RtcB family protein [Halobaculum sp.]